MRRHAVAFAVLLSLLLAGCGPLHNFRRSEPVPLAEPTSTQVRAVWVTQWDYRKPADVVRIMDNCAALGFNVIFFQVRTNGTVFYKSAMEPWAWELTGDSPAATGGDPGWDPLSVALVEAHTRGMELHAYVNVLPAWRTQQWPPSDSHQLWWEHPDWFMCDASGRRMLPRDNQSDPQVGDWYAFLSPGVPEVQSYLADLVAELVDRYRIDGIHLDYLRYPSEIREVEDERFAERARRLGNWSYDPVSLARFVSETGAAGPDADPDAWREWRVEQVTKTLRAIRKAIETKRPGLILTASVTADPADARATKYQDYLQWLQEGSIDGVVATNYTRDVEAFRARASMLLEPRPAKGFLMQGIGLRHSVPVLEQELKVVEELKGDGFALFSYSQLFDVARRHERLPLAEALAKRLPSGRARTPWSKH